MEGLNNNLKNTMEVIEPVEVLEEMDVVEVTNAGSKGTLLGLAIGTAIVLGAYGAKKLWDRKKAKEEMVTIEHVETVEEEVEEIEEIEEDEIQEEI